jgi:transposase-like protein
MSFKKIKQRTLEEFLAEISIRRGSKCPNCGSIAYQSSSNSNRFICSEKLCKKRFSPWEGTIFEDLKINKLVILQVLEMWIQKASINLISYMLEIDKKTVYRILRRLSAVLVPYYYNSLNADFIGEDQIVEVDESKFGKRKYNRGHHVDGVWVLGMIEKSGRKRIRLFVLDDRTRATLDEIIKNNIDPNSTIFTDCWKGYNGLKFLFRQHQTVNHSNSFKDPITGTHTNTIEGSWLGVKMHIPPRGRTKDKIQLYLVRYMLLKNSQKHPFWELVKYLF